MNKLFLILGLVVLSVGAIFVLNKKQVLPPPSIVPLPTVSSEVIASPTEEQLSTKDIVQTFLQNIADKKIAEAIAMMTKKAVPNDSTKQAWGVQFNAFKKLTVKAIEPSMQEEWTPTQQTYRVTMDVAMSEDSSDEAIPYFGYDNGVNIRWVTLEKEGAEWKVAGISTGP